MSDNLNFHVIFYGDNSQWNKSRLKNWLILHNHSFWLTQIKKNGNNDIANANEIIEEHNEFSIEFDRLTFYMNTAGILRFKREYSDQIYYTSVIYLIGDYFDKDILSSNHEKIRKNEIRLTFDILSGYKFFMTRPHNFDRISMMWKSSLNLLDTRIYWKSCLSILGLEVYEL